MTYFFYSNHPSKFVKVHKGSCGHCKEGTGKPSMNIHGTENGQWEGSYPTFQEAETNAAREARRQGYTLQILKCASPNSPKGRTT